MTGLLEFRILGPLEAHVGGQLVRLGGARQRSLLAALLIEAGRTQSLDRLAHAVWADEQPESVRTQIAIRVHGLRKAFRAAGCDAPVIVTEKYGYRLATDVAWVDAEEAGALTTRARTLAAAGDVDDAATLYGRALALWRGSALAELDSAAITTAGRGLDDTRLEVAERWADLELARGRPREVVSRLAALVEEHPLREGLRERLMLALSRAGRQADALESYRQGRELLLEELGLEPGDGLREAHQAVLRGMEEPAEPVHAVGRPAQLPPAVQGFVGRQEQLGLLDGLLEDAPYLPVAVVSG
ncbi:MAG: AfsR/SARP family transcriptional regulator, partial [Nonomuraea sp.]|nr:AfsR/SARP family transcriptional regulator [Nonomuraea sp.]